MQMGSLIRNVYAGGDATNGDAKATKARARKLLVGMHSFLRVIDTRSYSAFPSCHRDPDSQADKPVRVSELEAAYHTQLKEK